MAEEYRKHQVVLKGPSLQYYYLCAFLSCFLFVWFLQNIISFKCNMGKMVPPATSVSRR